MNLLTELEKYLNKMYVIELDAFRIKYLETNDNINPKIVSFLSSKTDGFNYHNDHHYHSHSHEL